MALTGLEIFKLLPRTNCGECNFPTCLAFAMRLAAKTVELSDCPYLSDEAKAILGEASTPPIRLIKIGSPGNQIEIGNETVLFRHEKTFVHKTGIAVQLSDKLSDEELIQKIKEIEDFVVVRVGEDLKADFIALRCDSGDADTFAHKLEIISSHSKKGLILVCDQSQIISKANGKLTDKNPLLYAADSSNYQEMAKVAKEVKATLALRADALDRLCLLSEEVRKLGVEDIVLDTPTSSLSEFLQWQTVIRRTALKESRSPLGYPTIAISKENNIFEESALAAVGICKYASIFVLNNLEKAELLTLLTLRQNIYTDPQKPIQVDAGIYSIGDPDKHSPVLVTTNFSLTYFTVAGEVENSGVPAYLIVTDCEGMSVLTAWAAGKFVPEKIAPFIKECGIVERVNHRRLIIPGYVAIISGELEENLPGWEVIVGTQEAADLPVFLKNFVGARDG